MKNKDNHMMDEPERIYKAVFKKNIPHLLKERFQKASQRLSSGFSQTEKEEYEKVLSRHFDLEALELAARWEKRLPLLISRFRIMVFLAETFPENAKFFINSDAKKFYAFLSLLVGGLRSVYKFIKGWILLRF